MSSFFIQNTTTLLVIVLLLFMIFSLSYYIVSLLFEIKKKIDILAFDSINNEIIGTFI